MKSILLQKNKQWRKKILWLFSQSLLNYICSFCFKLGLNRCRAPWWYWKQPLHSKISLNLITLVSLTEFDIHFSRGIELIGPGASTDHTRRLVLVTRERVASLIGPNFFRKMLNRSEVSKINVKFHVFNGFSGKVWSDSLIELKILRSIVPKVVTSSVWSP